MVDGGSATILYRASCVRGFRDGCVCCVCLLCVVWGSRSIERIRERAGGGCCTVWCVNIVAWRERVEPGERRNRTSEQSALLCRQTQNAGA